MKKLKIFDQIRHHGNIGLFCIVIAALTLCSTSACSDSSDDDNREWRLVWEADFEGQAGQSVNTSDWNIQVGDGTAYGIPAGWGNSELQSYTDDASNLAFDGQGNLAIVAREGGAQGARFSSARINTQNKFQQQYGRIEARIKLPWGQGIWPAFWMLGDNVESLGWPQGGEIDIMEYRGQEPNIIHGSVHGPGYSGGQPVTKKYTLANGRFDNDFHVFAIEWGEDYIDFFVDETSYQRITPDDVPGEWVYNQEFYILLNMAVGGNFAGSPNNSTVFPQTMLIDYVRVYEQVNE